jgi:hypothetical protein
MKRGNEKEYKILIRKHQEKRKVRTLGLNGNIILKRI